jgi:hypothetical protein
MTFEIKVMAWDMHQYVTEVNRLLGSQPLLLYMFVWYSCICLCLYGLCVHIPNSATVQLYSEGKLYLCHEKDFSYACL